MTITKAFIHEIFFSIQGEGTKIGTPQVFVRFAGCNLNCDYCDTPKSRYKKNGEIHTPEKLVEQIKKINKFNAKSISFTGGEPLLQSELIKTIIPELKKLGFKIYLETNGTLPQALKAIIDSVDIIAMDFKLVSSCGKNIVDIHRKFLDIGKTKTLVKLPLTNKTTFDEIKTVVATIEKVSSKIPTVLQPITKQKKVSPPEWKKIFEWYSWLRRNSTLQEIRILPQQHRFWHFK